MDGGSRDGTVEIVREHANREVPLQLILAGEAFPGEGRNLGTRAAAHEVIAFTDAGIRLDSRWLEKLAEPMARDESVDVVYGNLEPLTETFFLECAALAYVPAPVERNGMRIRAPFIPSSLMRRAVVEQTRGFPPFRASEDLIFMQAVEREKYRVAYAPEALAYWQLAPSWAATFGRFATYSYHNLAAGRARQWHVGVARIYAGAALVLALAVVHSPFWLGALLLGLLGRALRIAFRKRRGFAFEDVFHPRRIAYVMGLLLLMDAATAWGFLHWLAQGRPRPRAC